MSKFKAYLNYIKVNATDEMRGFAEVFATAIGLVIFAIVITVIAIYFENILKIVVYIILFLCAVCLVFTIIKAIYDFLKLTIKYRNKED